MSKHIGADSQATVFHKFLACTYPVELFWWFISLITDLVISVSVDGKMVCRGEAWREMNKTKTNFFAQIFVSFLLDPQVAKQLWGTDKVNDAHVCDGETGCCRGISGERCITYQAMSLTTSTKCVRGYRGFWKDYALAPVTVGFHWRVSIHESSAVTCTTATWNGVSWKRHSTFDFLEWVLPILRATFGCGRRRHYSSNK